MKLEDEILKIVNKNLEVSMPNENTVIVKGQWEFVTDIKSLIERYCKRQRELCAKQGSEVPCLDENERAEVYYHIERNSKLATEE